MARVTEREGVAVADGAVRPGATYARAPAKRRRADALTPYGFIAPFYILFIVFGAFPPLFGFYISLYHWNGLSKPQFVGLENYVSAVTDPVFWHSVTNVLIIAGLATVPGLVLALVLAFMLDWYAPRYRMVYLACLFVPQVVATPAATVVFQSIFSKSSGALDEAIAATGLPGPNWLGSPGPMKAALALLLIWRWLGYNTVIYFGGLQAIPAELYEAATVDGARVRQVLRFVTIPQMRRVILFTSVLSTVGILQLFTEPYLLAGAQGGQSGALLTPLMYIYDVAFQNFNFGYAAAISYILAVIAVVGVSINLFVARRRGAL
jgi:cellobiose transport system permease protein